MFEPPDSPQWVKLASTAEADVYGEASSRVRGEIVALMWAMRDFKKRQEPSDGGARFLKGVFDRFECRPARKPNKKVESFSRFRRSVTAAVKQRFAGRELGRLVRETV